MNNRIHPLSRRRAIQFQACVTVAIFAIAATTIAAAGKADSCADQADSPGFSESANPPTRDNRAGRNSTTLDAKDGPITSTDISGLIAEMSLYFVEDNELDSLIVDEAGTVQLSGRSNHASRMLAALKGSARFQDPMLVVEPKANKGNDNERFHLGAQLQNSSAPEAPVDGTDFPGEEADAFKNLSARVKQVVGLHAKAGVSCKIIIQMPWASPSNETVEHGAVEVRMRCPFDLSMLSSIAKELDANPETALTLPLWITSTLSRESGATEATAALDVRFRLFGYLQNRSDQP